MLDKTSPAKPENFALIFPTAEAMMTAMFGAPQHDWHVRRYRVFRKAKMQADWMAQRATIEAAPDFVGTRYAR